MSAQRGPIDATLVTGTVLLGLMAGLFAAFSYAVMPGLGRTGDETFVSAVQRINAAILNPVFGVLFAGALLVPVAGLVLQLRCGHEAAFGWALAAVILYVAVLAVTVAVNVPLNDTLDRAARAGADPRGAREHFEHAWAVANLGRALLCTGAFGAQIWALVVHVRGSHT